MCPTLPLAEAGKGACNIIYLGYSCYWVWRWRHVHLYVSSSALKLYCLVQGLVSCTSKEDYQLLLSAYLSWYLSVLLLLLSCQILLFQRVNYLVPLFIFIMCLSNFVHSEMQYFVYFSGTLFSPEELIGMILQQAKEYAETFAGDYWQNGWLQ